MSYNKLVETCFFNPEHIGSIDRALPFSVYHRSGEKGRGNIIDFYLLYEPGGKITKACFKAYGNPYFIAAAEWVCQQLEGSLIDKHPYITHSLLMELLELPKTGYPIALQIEDAYREIVMMIKRTN